MNRRAGIANAITISLTLALAFTISLILILIISFDGCEKKPACVPEVCDGEDNDCDGEIDEGVLLSSLGTWTEMDTEIL